MSKAIRFCKNLLEKLGKEFEEKLVDVPEVVVNEELQKKQFKEYKVWFDVNGYLFYNLPTIDFTVSTFEKIVELVRRFEPTMNLVFSEYTSTNNEQGIKIKVKKLLVFLLHDRFQIYEVEKPYEERKEKLSIEELADTLLKLYVEYGDHKKTVVELNKTMSV